MKPREPDLTPPQGMAPIADLSYRRYDGPLRVRRFRWFTIARAGAGLAFANRWYWLLCGGAFFPYAFYGLIFYLWKSTATEAPAAMRPPMLLNNAAGGDYAMLFYQAFGGFELLWLFGVALLVGAGAIASDNRANALMVYLARPITRADYLIGKWFGIFLPVATAALLPALALYLLLGFAFSNVGYFTSEPLLIFRILVAGLMTGALHASLLLGFSAWSSTARLAGAFYAGAYFLTGIISRALWIALYGFRPEKGVLIRHLSVPGLLQGLSQSIYGVTLERVMIGLGRQAFHTARIPPPNAAILAAVLAGACAAALAAAWWRIRAAEVVRG